jgi:acetyltransferase
MAKTGLSTAAPALRSDPRLARLLDPRSIAVLGASADPAKRGYQAVRALITGGYRYPLYPVNPKGGSVLGLPVARSIGEVPGPVDAALIVTPARTVPALLRDCAAAGVAGAVVVANGFRESGQEGTRLEADLRRAVADTGIRVIGPNTSGMFNLHTGANLVGLSDVPRGPVSVLTQSGNMLLSLVADNRSNGGPGFDIYVGLGNQADVGYHDCLAFLAGRDGTGAVAIHSEGFADGRAFLSAAAEATRTLPVVVLSGGKSAAGRQSALSHTGAVASSAAVTDALLRQAGVEVVTRSDELGFVASVLAISPVPPAGKKVAVLSDGGGHATLAVDALSARGVPLAELAPHTERRLRSVLGPAAAVRNPVDVAGATDARPRLFADAVQALFDDPQVGLVIMIGLFGGYHLRFDERLRAEEERTAARLVELSASAGTPILVESCYAVDRPSAHDILRRGGIQVLESIDHTVRAAAALVNRARRLATADERSDLRLRQAAPPRGETGRLLSEPAGRRLLESAGVATGDWRVVSSAEQAAEAVAAFARPCALKVVSADVAHKSDAGGVRLDVTAATATSDYAGLLADVTRAVPQAAIDGVVVVPMSGRGVELLVGVTRDAVFGPVVAFGSGGVLVEAVRDISFRAAPLTLLEAREMIEETVASRLLDGVRGLPCVDRDELARFLVGIGKLAAATPELRELDLNPVIAGEHGLLPVDVRVVLDALSRWRAGQVMGPADGFPFIGEIDMKGIEEFFVEQQF